MRFQHHDALRTFAVVARMSSFSAAADCLNLTKGAVSYQIKRLELALGFELFVRQARGIRLTAEGRELSIVASHAFADIEQAIARLSHKPTRILTIGVTTYFASRWLSPRLTAFMRQHPTIRLRIQPMIDLIAFADSGVDLAIRWGRGTWADCEIQPLFRCPAFPTGNTETARLVAEQGEAAAFEQLTLLRDRDDSDAWSDWFRAAGLHFRGQSDTLIIPDPNVRVQAVIDGQGVALNDALVQREIDSGQIHRLSATSLDDYGYFLAVPDGEAASAALQAFVAWVRGEPTD